MEGLHYYMQVIIRREKEAALIDSLKEQGITEIISTQVEGSGVGHGHIYVNEGGVEKVMLIPKMMLEIVVDQEAQVQMVIDTARKVCRTGLKGDGKIFVEECHGPVVNNI